MKISATVIEGPDLGLVYPLRDEPITLGKSVDADIVLTDGAVSKQHIEMTLAGSAVRIKDLDSTNGTYVGTTQLIESLVPAGSVITVGRTRIHLRTEEAPMMITPSEDNRFGDLWGDSLAMRQVFAILERIADKEVNVLLDGETGTGKELAARAIHERSGRSSGPLVVLDCGAVAPELVESQVFGHKRGAFTGAMQDRAGVFESAHGGTLFLDELDSLPLDLQPKLLRVVENREVTRLGEVTPRPVDVRLVAACGKSPEEGVTRGDLRRDLYFRLAVVRITLPSLRDRLEDLPLLVRVLLERIGGEGIEVSDSEPFERLRQHPWMGNIRELRNVLERALLLAPPNAGRFEELILRLSPLLAGAKTPDGAGLTEGMLQLPYKEAKDAAVVAFERDYLRAALARNGANLSKTARDVGLTRHHLRKLLRRHRLIASPETSAREG